MIPINDTQEIWINKGLTVGDLKAFLDRFNDDCPLHAINNSNGDHFKITTAKWNATTPGLGLNSEAILLF